MQYLPLLHEELEEKVVYIAEKLKNQQAANELLKSVEKLYLAGLQSAEAFEPIPM